MLENEELRKESINQTSSESTKIPKKALKKKTTLKKCFRKSRVGSIDTESSQGKYPEVVRCIKCFKSHFPSAKACKLFTATKSLDEKTKHLLTKFFNYLEKDKSDKKSIRLRGGGRK